MACYGVTTVTAAAVEPVTLQEAKKQVGVGEVDYHDDQLTRLITSARQLVEELTDRTFITSTFDFKFDRWPLGLQPIFIPQPPLQTITSIKYFDTSGVEQTLGTSTYKVLAERDPGEIRLKTQQSWPFLYSETDVVTIRFVAGYGAAASSVPGPLKQAILMAVSMQWLDSLGNDTAQQQKCLERLAAPWQCGHEFHTYGRDPRNYTGMASALGGYPW